MRIHLNTNANEAKWSWTIMCMSVCGHGNEAQQTFRGNSNVIGTSKKCMTKYEPYVYYVLFLSLFKYIFYRKFDPILDIFMKFDWIIQFIIICLFKINFSIGFLINNYLCLDHVIIFVRSITKENSNTLAFRFNFLYYFFFRVFSCLHFSSCEWRI